VARKCRGLVAPVRSIAGHRHVIRRISLEQ